MSDRPELQNRVIILNGYTDPEIVNIMRVVKSIYSDVTPEAALANIAAARQVPEAKSVSSADLIFAKATRNSLEMKLADIVADVSEDHEYLRNNPPSATGDSKAPGPTDPDRGGNPEGGS